MNYQEWSLPSSANGHRKYCRVTVTTEDDATIYIIFSKPALPEYVIENNTDHEIFVC
jgi:hypothetical protein